MSRQVLPGLVYGFMNPQSLWFYVFSSVDIYPESSMSSRLLSSPQFSWLRELLNVFHRDEPHTNVGSLECIYKDGPNLTDKPMFLDELPVLFILSVVLRGHC